MFKHAVLASHEAVDHSKYEWARGDVHTNTLEGFFSIFKRGIIGVYQHVDRQHFERYLAEFDFRMNTAPSLASMTADARQIAVDRRQGQAADLSKQLNVGLRGNGIKTKAELVARILAALRRYEGP